MSADNPLILITNDDGISAKGLRSLVEAMKEIGRVVVVAPDKPQSGMSHAITVSQPLRLNKHVQSNGYEEYSCNGTPVDSVKMGSKLVLKEKPDLVVSGINHGSNASVNIMYSGTMAAVLEACIDGIPAIGFSLLDYSADANFSACAPYIRKIASAVLKNGLPGGVCLNVNIPAVESSEIKGIKICRQADSCWHESFDERTDPHHRNYYWLKGVFEARENGTDTDQWALQNNYVSVVPVQYDLTAHNSIEKIKSWNLG